jgi:predicted transcriptional regulator
LIKKIFSGYRTGKPGLEKVLGSLESDVMEVVWLKDTEVSVRDIFETLSCTREIAYTTVMTIMGRLADKGLLTRRKEGNAFLFSPVITREDFTAQLVDNVVDDLLSDFSEAAMASFINRVGKKDLEAIEKLEKMLKVMKENNDDSNLG